jgi:hypothetical protein
MCRHTLAVVDSAGSLVRNCGAVNSDNPAVGDYRVLFNPDVSTCACVTTSGLPGVGIPPTGQVSVAGLANLNRVAIRTSGDRGAAVNPPFHLAIHCCPEEDED